MKECDDKFKKGFLKLIDMSILETYVSDEHKSDCIDDGISKLIIGLGILGIHSTANDDILYLRACKSYIWDEWGEEKIPRELSLSQHKMRYNTLCKVRDNIDEMIKTIEARCPELQEMSNPEGAYKAGDMVVFVKNRIYTDEENKKFIENIYLGVLDKYSVDGFSGKQYCSLKNMFHIINTTSLSIAPHLDGEYLKSLIDDKLFARSIMPSSKSSWVCGLLKISIVDEKHFPKLNSIVEKIAKPDPGKLKISGYIPGHMFFGRY